MSIANALGGVLVGNGATQNRIGKPDELRLFVASEDTNNLIRVSGANGSLQLTTNNGAGGLVSPRGVCLAQMGKSTCLVAVLMTRYFDLMPKREYLDTFVTTGSGGLDNPHGITFGPDGNLYVSSAGSKILRYNGVTGAFINNFVPSEAADWQLPAV